MSPSITIVVPVYNEAEFIPIALPQLISAADASGARYIIRVVENGSTDRTADVAKIAKDGQEGVGEEPSLSGDSSSLALLAYLAVY